MQDGHETACQPVKDKNRTVAGNGECRRHKDMLAGSEAWHDLMGPRSNTNFPGIWCNFKQEMLKKS